jgi:hypothetical protein
LVIVLLTCCFGAGDWLFARLPGERRPIERVLFATTLGAGALGTVILVLGSVGFLNPVWLWGAVILSGLIGYRQLQDLPRLIIQTFATVRGSDAVGTVIARVVLVGIAGLLLVGALAPPTDWDSLMYHLEIPRRFLEVGRIHSPEDNLHIAYVGVLHMLYLPLLSVGATTGPALLSAAFALLLGLAVLSAGDRFFGRVTGIASFVVLWGSSIILLGAVTPRVDVTLALFLFLCHYGLLVALDSDNSWGFTVAALLAGTAIGIKHLALVYLASLAPVAIWVLIVRFGTNGRQILRWLSIYTGLAAIVALPWLVKNLILLGALFYPVVIADPILPPWIRELASRHHLAAVSRDVYGVLGHAREPITFAALVFRPGSLTVESELRWAVTNPAFFFLPLSLLLIRTRLLAMLLIPAVAYLILLLAPREFTNLRYLIPAYPALTLIAVESIRRTGSMVLGDKRVAPVLQIVCVLALVPMIVNASFQVANRPAVAAALGRMPQQEYLAATRPGYFEVTQWLNDYTTSEDRILLLFEARGYYFERNVLQDNVVTNWALLRAIPAFRRCLQDSGITHILVNQGSADYLRNRGADLSLLGWNHFNEFADVCLELAHAERGFKLFRVKS